MQLLVAYNRLLQAAGELKVELIDGLHPMHEQVMAVLDNTTVQCQLPGWWFNKYRQDLTYPYTIPSNLDIRGWRRGYDPVLVVGQNVYELATRKPVTDPTITVEVIESVEFTSLPEVFAEWVVCSAEFELARTFDADGNKIQLMAQAMSRSFSHVHATNVRNANVNMLRTPSMIQKFNQSMQYPRRVR